jgi:large repetitive protein
MGVTSRIRIKKVVAPTVVVLIALGSWVAGAVPASAATSITSFSPQSGPVGTSVSISGHGFTGAKNVKFNNTSVGASGFTVNSNVSITATVPTGATTGKISVVAADNSTATSTGDFVVTSGASASISSFVPTCGPVGTSVTITGTNFTGATAVAFGGTSASYTVNSSLKITATVPAGANSGKISVTGADSVTVSSAATFTVTGNLAAAISSFNPTSGPVGTSVTITGTNLCGASAVTFNATPAPGFTVSSNTQITATVPSGATTGKIGVTTPVNTATSATDFTVTNPSGPTITSFTPTFGLAGTKVTITGTNFTGATQVMIGSKADPTFTVVSNTSITATVQNGAHSGPISVTTPSGTATSATDFTVGSTAPPQIVSFVPTSGPVGTKVTITGTGFTGATSVDFNGAVDPTFKVDSDTQISATVPVTATTGKISVTGPGGTGTSSVDFVVTSPFISAFTPAVGPWGTQVVLSGANLTGATSVKFNGTTAAFTVNSGAQITATVPNGATTGPISVTTPNGTGLSADPFTIKHLRSISLSLSGKLKASGTVTVTDGTAACASTVPVKIQHRVNGNWRTVGTGTTTSTGSYSIRVAKDSGKYRAKATKTTLANDDVCGKARSAVVFH